MGDAIDFEAVRHRLKLRRDTGNARLFENRDDVGCPVCGDAFDEALETTERSRQLSTDSSLDVCIVREPEQLLIFTHTRESQ